MIIRLCISDEDNIIAHKEEETAVSILGKTWLSKCDFVHVPRLYS